MTTTTMLPSCTGVGAARACLTAPAFNRFEIATQTLTLDPTNAPFSISSSPATQAVFDNGYAILSLIGDQAVPYAFKQGFNFYGINYASVFVSANGYVSFGAISTSFPSITVNNIRTGVPRVMSFYTDLAPGIPAYLPQSRIYVQQFRDAAGVAKVKIVHERVAEFLDTTGPHGGEIVLTLPFRGSSEIFLLTLALPRRLALAGPAMNCLTMAA